jgi:uncharacterized RDD family membrane protein YckC
MNTIKVKTTQHVEVEYAIASLGDRILAHLIDGAVYFGWIIVSGMLLALLDSKREAVLIPLALFMALPVVFYSLLCEIFLNGQSLGKKARNIKVIKLSGQAPSLGDYLLRWVFRLVDILPYGVPAMITIAVNGKGQRLGDLAAGTTVIRLQAFRRKQYFEVRPNADHVVTFPEVNALTDTDMALIRKLLYKALQYQNALLLERLAQQTRHVMDVRPEPGLADEQFLRLVIRDYYQVMSRQAG